MSKYTEVKERIAKYLYNLEPIHVDETWEETCDKEEFRERADKILSDPDLLIRSDNQECPETPLDDFGAKELFAYGYGQGNMQKANFVKVERKDNE